MTKINYSDNVDPMQSYLSSAKLNKATMRQEFQKEVGYRFFFINILYIIIYAVDMLKVAYADLNFDTDDGSKPFPWTAVLYVLHIIFYAIVSLRFNSRKEDEITNLDKVLLILSVICTCIGYGMKMNDKIVNANKMNTQVAWMDTVGFTSDCIWMVVFFEIFFPFWFLRIMIPCTIFISIAASAYQIGNPEANKILIRECFYICYIIILFFVKDFMTKQNGVDKFNTQTWNLINQLLLDKVSQKIALIDSDGKTLYSNREFKELFTNQGGLTELINLNKRQKNQTQESDHETNIKKAVISNHLAISMRRTPQNSLKAFDATYQNLQVLINECLQRLRMGELDDKETITYDGKLMLGSKFKGSYEVRIIPLAPIDKIIVLLYNTTERDTVISLEYSNKYKDSLLASVSHELRTPLNGNLSMIESVLEMPDITEHIKKGYLIPALRSGKYLLNLINDILDFSQIKAQELRLVYQNQNIHDTVNNCVQLIEIQTKKKGLKLNANIAKDVPQQWNTDHNRLSQIIINLLSNALKFTFQGSITTTVTMKNKSTLELSVQDTGIGIKKEDQVKLFKKFAKIDLGDKMSSNSTGVGLGLTIANMLSKMLGPKDNDGIEFETEYGKGTKFSFEIENKVETFDQYYHRRVEEEHRIRKTRSVDNLELRHRLSNKSQLMPSVKGRSEQRTTIAPISPYVNRSQNKQDTVSPKREDAVGQRLDSERDLLHDEFSVQADELEEQVTESTNSIVIPADVRRINPGEVQDSKTTDPQKINSEGGVIKILIVDDDPFNILALENILGRIQAYSIQTVYNGQEAVDKIQEGERYGIIFMDCNMPIMDGFEATAKIKEIVGPDEMAIIGCTAFNSQQEIQRCLECGTNEVLTKPISFNTVSEIMVKYGMTTSTVVKKVMPQNIINNQSFDKEAERAKNEEEVQLPRFTFSNKFV